VGIQQKKESRKYKDDYILEGGEVQSKEMEMVIEAQTEGDTQLLFNTPPQLTEVDGKRLEAHVTVWADCYSSRRSQTA